MNLQTFFANILTFLNGTIIPFLIAIAFLVFLFNAFRYFILGGDNEDDQAKARSLATWGIVAFVVIVSLWGIVNLFVNGLGLNNQVLAPDYMRQKNPSGTGATDSGNSSRNYVDNDEGYRLPGIYETRDSQNSPGTYNPGEAPQGNGLIES